MTPDELFAGFPGYDPEKQKQYERELIDEYGDSMRVQIDQSKQRMGSWSKEQAREIASNFAVLERELAGLIELARRTRRNGSPATKDATIRQKLAQLWIDTEVFKYTGARAITKLLKGELPGPEASTGKMMWVEGHQRLQELAMEIQGPYSQLTRGSKWAIESGLWQYSFLRSLANSIEGGTTEIMKNIIGERVLGLPKG